MYTGRHEEWDAVCGHGSQAPARENLDASLRAEQLRAGLRDAYLDAISLWGELHATQSPARESHRTSHGIAPTAGSAGRSECAAPTGA